MALQGHPRSLILAGIESMYATSIGISSNLGPILPRFRDITGFLLRTTSPLFHPNFRVVLIGLDYRCCGSEPRSEDPKLTIRVISFELVQPICPRYLNVTDGETDGRLTIAIPRFALCIAR